MTAVNYPLREAHAVAPLRPSPLPPPPHPDRPVDLSLVVPVYNEEEVIDPFLRVTTAELEQTGLTWEILFIDDGSTDRTAALIAAAVAQEGRIRLVSLSRNFGKEAALTCGLDYASGSAVIPIDVDLQDPPAVIHDLIRKWREGYLVVNAIRSDRSRDGRLKRGTAAAFYWIMVHVLRAHVAPNAGDFRLMDRQVVQVIRQMRESNRFMKGLFSWPGFKTGSVSYIRHERRAGHTKLDYWKLWKLAISGMLAFSNVPLRLWLYLGTVISLASLLYAVWIIVQKLVFGNPVAGYPSLMVAMLFLGGVQLMSLGIIGEYIARIFDEVKGRPLYVVAFQVDGETPRPREAAPEDDEAVQPS